jgi:hypothetical protein
MSGDRCRCKSTDVASRSAVEFVRCHTRLRVRTLAGEKNNFCDAQTHISKERRALARRGYRNSFAETQARLFGVPPAAYVQVAVALAFLVTTGANAPRSCLASADACRCEKQFLRCTNAHQQRAAGVSPPWV